MSIKEKISVGADADLHLAFDVGHSSIGWAVLQPGSQLEIKGCGAVVFRADDCLASSRRAYRRQRRHIRSTRGRIARLKTLLRHLGVLTETELNRSGCAWPWKLASQILRGGKLLTWPELWDVLRWYAHNRGYDGNRRWSAAEVEAQSEDSKKEANARTLMGKYGTKSMAETFCAMSGIDPLGKKKSANLSGDKRPKGQNAAFPRETVEGEVCRILNAHFGKLEGVDANFEKVLFSDWSVATCPNLKLPKRYQGGLLFGQLVPRFDNRIISLCPITWQNQYENAKEAIENSDKSFLKKHGVNLAKHDANWWTKHIADKLSKVPSRNCPEFLNFRWAMQLANIKVGKAGDRELQPLRAEHRLALDKQMHERGYLTPKELKDAVRNLTSCERDNLDTMLMHPDAKEALLLDPVQKLVTSEDLKPFWNLLPERLRKRLCGQWRRSKVFTLAQIREQLESLGDTSAYDAELQRQVDAHNSKAKQKDKQTTREELLQKDFPSKSLKLDGRAAFARPLLKQAYDDVLAGKPHPKEEGGCLFITEKIREAQLDRAIADQTNNHLVRHRLLILERLLADIVKEYAGNKKECVRKITIEVNRDLQAMSGKNSVEKAEELNKWLAPHKRAKEKLEKMLIGSRIKIGQGLIRKAVIADDLGWDGEKLRWICPYTNQFFDAYQLASGEMQKDHIVPKVERSSDALEALVMTFSKVNEFKKKRTAWTFVKQEQGNKVPGTNLEIRHITDYEAFVKSIPIFQSKARRFEYRRTRRLLPDEARRKKKKELMMLASYEEKEFIPKDATQTSQLVRLGAQILRKNLPHLTTADVVSLPGFVTGKVRTAWNLNACLELACPQVMEEAIDENGKKIRRAKIKSEIRGLTNLHHALDACVLSLAAIFIPNTGQVWKLITKRTLDSIERRELGALRVFGFNQENRFALQDLDKKCKEQIRQRLAEKRVVQHLPASMSGLPTKETVWRVFDPNVHHKNSNRIKKWLLSKGVVIPSETDSTTLITRRKRKGGNEEDEAGGKTFHETETWAWVYDEVEKSKVLGFDSVSKKLRALKGGKLIDDNFGMAIYPNAPEGEDRFKPIRFFKVWKQIQNLPKAASGKRPQIIRRGQIIRFERGRFAGRFWRVLGIEDNGKIRFFEPDFTRRIDKPENYERVMITSLLRDGIQVIKTPLTGVASCPTTSSA